MRFESPRHFRRPFFYILRLISFKFSRRVPFSQIVSSLRISPIDSYFPVSSLLAFISSEFQHGFKTSYFLSWILSYYRPYSRAFTLLITSYTIRVQAKCTWSYPPHIPLCVCHFIRFHSS